MTRRGRVGWVLGSVAAVATAAGLVLAGPAAAHSQLVSSSPTDGAVLPAAPTEVVFTFDEDLLPGVDTIAISDADGKVISSTTVEPEGSVVRAPWPSGLPDGTYQAAYRIVSADGHPVSGAILVRLDRTASSSTASSSTASSSTASSSTASSSTAATGTGPGGSSVALLAGVSLVALVLAGGLLWLGRRRRDAGGGA